MKKVMMFGAAMLAATVMGEMKIATVNMVDLVKYHPTHESNRTLVKSTEKDYRAKMDAGIESLKAISEDGKKLQSDMMNPMLSASAKAEVQKKMEALAQQMQNEQRKLASDERRYQEELSDLEQRLIKLETDDIRAKITAYAEANKIDLVLDSTMCAFASTALDITPAILTAIGGKKPAEEKK